MVTFWTIPHLACPGWSRGIPGKRNNDVTNKPDDIINIFGTFIQLISPAKVLVGNIHKLHHATRDEGQGGVPTFVMLGKRV